MNNEDAYIFFTARKDKPITSIASEFIVLNSLETLRMMEFGENFRVSEKIEENT